MHFALCTHFHLNPQAVIIYCTHVLVSYKCVPHRSFSWPSALFILFGTASTFFQNLFIFLWLESTLYVALPHWRQAYNSGFNLWYFFELNFFHRLQSKLLWYCLESNHFKRAIWFFHEGIPPFFHFGIKL